ncbi:hypothetical protein SALBM135S_07675 [Streptomyces alboniger]
MSEDTPSQAEGERDEDGGEAGRRTRGDRAQPPRTTPSQAEGDDDGEGDDTDG